VDRIGRSFTPRGGREERDLVNSSKNNRNLLYKKQTVDRFIAGEELRQVTFMIRADLPWCNAFLARKPWKTCMLQSSNRVSSR
jgi:hypothetical protein